MTGLCADAKAEAATCENDDGQMHYTDEKLQNILRVARGCICSHRVPGEMRQRDFFERFAAQDAEREAIRDETRNNTKAEVGSETKNLMESQVLSSADDPICLPAQPGMSPETHAAKLRRDHQSVRRAVVQRRQDLENATATVSRETLARCKAENDAEAAKAEVLKLKQDIRDVRYMYKRHERDIEELQAILEITKIPSRTVPASTNIGDNSEQAIEGLQANNTGNGILGSARASAEGVAIISPRTNALPAPGKSMELLEKSLFHEHQPIIPSVVDLAVDRLETPAARDARTQMSECGGSVHEGDICDQASAATVTPVVGNAFAPKNKKAYASVLSQPPGSYKLFI